MRRRLIVVAFFVVLLGIWEALVRMKIWSPVLVPSPLSVAGYLRGALASGDLEHATFVTVRRLLIGYALGLVVGLPLGLLTARFKFCEVHPGRHRVGIADAPERVLGAAGVAVVRADRRRRCCSWSSWARCGRW
jgi:NitT/TauT family transport system permease protein